MPDSPAMTAAEPRVADGVNSPFNACVYRETCRAALAAAPPPVVGVTVCEAVDRVLNENSAWIARPDHKVTERVAFAATVACYLAMEKLPGAPITELPVDLREPLHSLQADMRQLLGRVADDSSVAGMVAESVLERLSQIETACYAILSRIGGVGQ